MYEPHQHLQEYGTEIEVVPKEARELNVVIEITNLPYDTKALLFRDMGQGHGLVTKKIAETFEKGLAQLVRSSDESLKSRLIRMRNPSKS